MQATAAGRLAFSSSSTSSSSFSFGSRKRGIIDISGALFNIKRRGISFTASVPSDSPKPQKGKKISLEERRALVESFIEKYRTTNAGRYPSASAIKRETGGSYYTVRQIVQELQHNQKFSPFKKIDTVQAEKVQKVSGCSKEATSVRYGGKLLEKISDAKEEPSTYDRDDKVDKINHKRFDTKERHSMCNGYEEVEEVTFQNFDATKRPSISDRDQKVEKVGNQSFDARKVPPTSDGNKILEKATQRSSKAIEESSICEEHQKMKVCDQSFDTKVEPSTCNANEKVEKVDNQSFGPEVEPNIKNKEGPSLLKSKTEDNLQSLSGQFVGSRAENNTIVPSQNTHESRGDKVEVSNIVTHKEEQQSEHLKRSEHEEASSKASSLWKNLRSFTDGIISFWKKL